MSQLLPTSLRNVYSDQLGEFIYWLLGYFHCSADQDELFDLILTGEFEYLSPFWDDISESAKVGTTLVWQ